jgi:hypothetical protein
MNKFKIGQLTSQGKIKGYYIFNDSLLYIIQNYDKEIVLKEEQITLLTSNNDVKKTPKFNFLEKTKEGVVMGTYFEESQNEFYHHFSIAGWVDEDINWYAESLITD